MARTVNVKQAALRKAREKRLALDADRDVRDRRIEDATADVLVLVDERVESEAALARINEQIGAGLRRLLDEGVRVEEAAELGGLDTAEVRRLTKPPSAAGDETSAEVGGTSDVSRVNRAVEVPDRYGAMTALSPRVAPSQRA